MRNTLLLITLMYPFTQAAARDVERAMRVFDLRFIAEEPATEGRMPGPPVLRTDPEARIPAAIEANDIPPEERRTRLEPETIAEAIKTLIAPDSWSNARNSLEVEEHRLIMVQTPDVLDLAGKLISALEARAGRLIALDLALVPPSALEKIAPTAMRPGSSSRLESDAIERALAASDGKGVLLSALLREGAASRFQPPQLSLRLGDYDVNQAYAPPVVNPVVTAFLEGSFAEALAFVSPGGGWLRVDVRLGHAASRGEPEKRRFTYGDLELPRVEREEIAVSAGIREGMTLILGFLSMPASGAKAEAVSNAPSFAALLRARLLSLESGVDPLAEDVPHAIDAGILLTPPCSFGSRSRPGARGQEVDVAAANDEGSGEDISPPQMIDPEVLLSRVSTLLGESGQPPARIVLGGSAVILRGSAEEAMKVRSDLEAWARERGRMVSIDLWQGAAGADEIAAGSQGALLDASWAEKMGKLPGLRTRITGSKGARLSLASVAARSYICDLHMISGASDGRTSVVSDPDVGMTGAGLILEAACDLVPGNPWAQLHVNGELARPPVFGRQARVRSTHHVTAPEVDGGLPTAHAGDRVDLDLPDEDFDLWRHLVTVPLGRPVLLNALPDPASPGKARVLIALVTELTLEDAPVREGRF